MTEGMMMGDVRFEGHSLRMDTYARVAGTRVVAQIYRAQGQQIRAKRIE